MMKHHTTTTTQRWWMAIVFLGFGNLLLIGSTPVESFPSNYTVVQPLDRHMEDNSTMMNRGLQSVTSDFVPLSCNANLASASCSSTWTNRFGSGTTQSSRIVIPCGQCITMNHPGPTLTLQDGIDIQGKLVFPSNLNNLVINTPAVIVQGQLDMQATTPVDGTPAIRIVMTGGNDQSFTPIGSNSNACGGNRCVIGKKSFTVAGGRLNIRGLPSNTPSWVNLRDVSSDLRSIIVDAAVQGKWAPGSEILITSHTTKWDGHQVRTITAVNQVGSDGNFVSLTLNNAIDRPTTLLDSTDFAVEVALLSRNIVFQGGSDSNSLHGGHFWIMNTPKVQQYIEGIDFQNFGQQGTLGRYPIHFHLCGDVSGAIVIKNTIRLSNQRCIVVHGTNNLRVESNVAFNTKGHCFMLEDGIETGNTFIRNLGAMTSVAQRLIPNMGTNGRETDNSPATFWITNPTNSWIENVAAGSERSGFWFELLKRGPRASLFPNIDPKHDSLTLFQDNVAHSSAVHGVKTYPSGYLPDSEAALVGVKAYRNSFGLFIHVSSNIVVQGGLYADNKISIDVDRDEFVTVDGPTVIGESESYRQYLASKRLTSQVCSNSHIGIELHTQMKTPEAPPIVIKDVVFSDFSHMNCADAVPFSLDASTETGIFDSFTTIEGITFESSGDKMNFCPADLSRVRDVYIIDLDGSLRPAGSGATSGTASLVSDEPNMLSFIDSSKCTLLQGNCYSYCRGTCFRTVRYQVDPAGSYQLKVCKRGTSNCIFLSGTARTDDPTFAKRPREFVAHLPSGSVYDVTFVTTSGAATWPSFVDVSFDPALCPEAVQEDDVQLIVPTVTDATCSSLIRNGNFQASNTATTFWLHNDGGITLSTNRGVGGTNAAAGIERRSTATFFQFIDNRCMDVSVGEFYELTASIKLLNSDGSTFTCNPDRQACPDIGLHTNSNGFQRVATVTGTLQNGFHTATGFVQISNTIATASQVAFFVRSQVNGKLMIVDNVTMRRQERDCSNLIRASTMETDEWETLWQRSIVSGSGGTYTSVSPGSNSQKAIKYGTRRNSVEGPYYTAFRNVEFQCLQPSTRWRISAQMKLINRSNGQGVSCNINGSVSQNPCPSIQISMRNGNRERFFSPILRGYVNSNWNANTFNQFQADMTLPSTADGWDGSLRSIEFLIRDFTTTYDLILDNVSFAAL